MAMRVVVLVILVHSVISGDLPPGWIGWADKPWDYEVLNYPMKVEGSVPEWVDGTFWRHSCGREIGHWFGGLGLLNDIRITKGDASYNTRFILSGPYCQARPPHYNGVNCQPNALNTAVAFEHLHDRTVLSTADTECMNMVNASNDVASHMMWENDEIGCTPPFSSAGPAHMQYDPWSGDTFAFKEIADPKTKVPQGYEFYILSRDNPRSRVKVGTVPPHPMFGSNVLYVHAFGLTENYVILGEAPWTNGFFDTSCPHTPEFPFNCYDWVPGLPSLFRIISRKTWEVVTSITTHPYCYFHVGNAYEFTNSSGSFINMDTLSFPEEQCVQVMRGLVPAKLVNGSKVYMKAQMQSTTARWVLPILEGSNRTTHIDQPTITGPLGVEMPAINRNFNTRKYRYLFAAQANSVKSTIWDAIVKVDWETGAVAARWHIPEVYVMEPVFVPEYKGSTNPEHEDKGVLLSLALQSSTNTSFVLVLNGTDLTETARYWLPDGMWVPFGFHGLWMDSTFPLHS